MKIALLNESFAPLIDGVSIVVTNYAENFLKFGDTPFVIIPHMENENDDSFDFKIMRFQSFKKDTGMGYPIGNPISGRLISRILKEGPDILHAHSPFAASVIARQVRQKAKVPYVITYHTRFEIEYDQHLNNKPFRKVAEKFLTGNLKAADEVWVVSEGCRDSLRKMGYDGDYYVMRNGTDFAKGVAAEEQIKALREKYHIQRDEDLFLYIGRVEKYKNLKMSMDALKKLKLAGKKFKFLIVGKGLGKEELESYSKEIGMEESIIFTGPIYNRGELRVFYSAADLFLFPSTFDTAGLVVMEAAACNCPSIVVKGSCAAEIVTDERNGFLCYENADSLYEKITHVMNDREKLKEIGEMARDELVYSFEEAVRDARKRYEYLIGKLNKKNMK